MEVRVIWVDLIRSAGHMPIAGDVDLDVTCRGGYDPLWRPSSERRRRRKRREYAENAVDVVRLRPPSHGIVVVVVHGVRFAPRAP